MRRVRPLPALACVLLAWAGCAPRGDTKPSRIVLILVDTLRRDHLPMFGGAVETPNLAALAQRGVALAATASFHQTSMSMGALFTGRTPSLETGDPAKPLVWRPTTSCGMWRFAAELHAGECLPPTLPTLAEKLRARGYYTVGVVANLLLFDPAGFSRGFDRWEPVGRTEGREALLRVAPQAWPKKAAELRAWPVVNAAVREALAELPDAPLFLYVHYVDVHDWPYTDRSYAQSVAEMDRGIGDLLALLEVRDLLDGAAIVLTSDHGELLDARHVVESLPLHLGNPSYRDVLEVPLLLVGADAVELPAFPRTQDLHGILLALADAPESPAGELSPDELFLTEREYQTYQRGRFKSFRRRDGHLTLLDLEADPQELHDVAAAHPDVVKVHGERVDALTRALATKPLRHDATPASEPTSEEWLERLRAMGYAR